MKYSGSILLFLAFIIFNFTPVWAQQTYMLKGQVASGKEKLTDFSVILLLPGDSSLYKGDYFLTDEFSIQTEKLPVLLRISSLGYRDTIFRAETSEQFLKVSLCAQLFSLDEVVVTAQRPLFSAKPGHYTMNVDNTILSQSGTAVDLLKKMARVRINEKQEVLVLGVGNAVVLVDGRQLPADRSISSISSSEIQKIEVITNPSSKYDAEGKAIVEITTKSAQNKPWELELTARAGKGEYWRGYTGLEATAQLSRFSVYTFYAYNPEKELFSEEYTRDYTRTSSPQLIRNSVETINNTVNNNFRLSTDYRISDRQNVGLQVSGQYTVTDADINDLNQLYQPLQTIPKTLLSKQQGELKKHYTSGTFYHSYHAISGKLTWNSLFDYSLYDTDKKMNIDETSGSGQAFKENDEQTHIDIFSGKTDVQITLPNDFRLDPGAKLTFSRNNSNTNFISSGGEKLTDYDYRESIGAVYAIASKQFLRLKVEAGMRLETSGMYAKTDGLVIQDETRTDLFPSASLGYQLNKDWALNATYAKKITRPTFQDLNPAIIYVDSLSYMQGNPLLVPEIRNTVDLKLVYMGFASLGVSYTRSRNPFAWYIEQDASNPAVTRATQINIDRSDSYTIDLMLPYQNEHLTVYLATGLIYTKTNDSRANVSDLKRPMWYCYSGLDLSLPWKLKLNANTGYYTKGVVNIFTVEPMFRMDAGLSRKFLSEKLNVSLEWNDIFRSADIASYSTMNNRYLHYSFYNDQSYVQLAVSYRFNDLKNKFRPRSVVESETERIKGLHAN